MSGGLLHVKYFYYFWLLIKFKNRKFVDGHDEVEEIMKESGSDWELTFIARCSQLRSMYRTVIYCYLLTPHL